MYQERFVIPELLSSLVPCLHPPPLPLSPAPLHSLFLILFNAALEIITASIWIYLVLTIKSNTIILEVGGKGHKRLIPQISVGTTSLSSYGTLGRNHQTIMIN